MDAVKCFFLHIDFKIAETETVAEILGNVVTRYEKAAKVFWISDLYQL